MMRKICSVEDVYEGEARSFELGAERILVARIGDAWYAVADKCSHAEASLAFGKLDAEARTVSCPLHGGVFDLVTGEGLEYPAVEPIETYRVVVEAGDIYLDVE
jgi:nitrite reductase/ring-hydroxylating ferredoxin subunit